MGGGDFAYDKRRPPHLRKQAGGVADYEGVDVAERIRKCPDPTKWQRRILAGVAITEGGCWEWSGRIDRYGYGWFRFSEAGVGRMTGAHRAAWLAFEGDIPGDLVIDHLCRNKRCVNTAHLDLVSNAVNTLRSDHSNKAGRSGRPRHLHGSSLTPARSTAGRTATSQTGRASMCSGLAGYAGANGRLATEPRAGWKPDPTHLRAFVVSSRPLCPARSCPISALTGQTPVS